MKGRRDHCIRCGDCCLSSSPTLQIQDLDLIRKGILKWSDLYAVRRGELVRNNIRGRLELASREMIKVKERLGEQEGACILYVHEQRECTIYEQRPAQCVALKCWDASEFLRVFRGRKPFRKDIIDDPLLMALVEKHEERCSYALLHGHVKAIEVVGESAVDGILELLRYDFHMRKFLLENLHLNRDEMDLIFGRPLMETITMFGLKVVREGNGEFFLTMA